MTAIDQAEAEFRKIWPAGPDCPHEYAAAGFRALAKAREEMARITKERDEALKDLWCAEDQWGEDWLWQKWGLSRLLTEEWKKSQS